MYDMIRWVHSGVVDFDDYFIRLELVLGRTRSDLQRHLLLGHCPGCPAVSRKSLGHCAVDEMVNGTVNARSERGNA